MAFITKIHDHLDALDSAKFYRYVAIMIVIVFVVMIGGVYYFYSSVSSLHSKIEEINELRAGKVQSILGRIEHVFQQRAEVDGILKQDENFKIIDKFNKMLGPDQLNMADNKVGEPVISTKILNKDYSEDELTVKLDGITMKQLTELLSLIEQNKRISTKALEIQRANKQQRSINVSLTITTLQRRTAATD